MLHEAHIAKDGDLERQSEESSDNQLNVYPERADQDPGGKRSGGREDEKSTGTPGLLCIYTLILKYTSHIAIYEPTSICVYFVLLPELKIKFLCLHYLIIVVNIASL